MASELRRSLVTDSSVFLSPNDKPTTTTTTTTRLGEEALQSLLIPSQAVRTEHEQTRLIIVQQFLSGSTDGKLTHTTYTTEGLCFNLKDKIAWPLPAA